MRNKKKSILNIRTKTRRKTRRKDQDKEAASRQAEIHDNKKKRNDTERLKKKWKKVEETDQENPIKREGKRQEKD